MTDTEKLMLAKDDLDKMLSIEGLQDNHKLICARELIMRELAKDNPSIGVLFSYRMGGIFLGRVCQPCCEKVREALATGDIMDE